MLHTLRFWLCQVLFFVFIPDLTAQEADYSQRLVGMLNAYQELLAPPLPADTNEDRPRESWFIASRAIGENLLRFTVDPTPGDSLTGARFQAIPGSQVTHIIVKQSLLDRWPDHPSFCFSVLTRAVHSASLFFLDPEGWGLAQRSPMERLFIRVDGYAVEAELIRDRILGAGYPTTPYENYILDSYEKDHLVSAMLFLERVSLPVVQGLYSIQSAFETDPDEAVVKRALAETGNSLLEARNGLPDSGADRQIYPAAIAVHTWLEYSPLLLSRIHNIERPSEPLNFDEILALESEYSELRQLLEAKRIRDLPLIEHVYQETVKGF